MKWLLAGCAAVALSGGAALAGPCAQQITALQHSLSRQDAGAGPTRTSADTGRTDQVSEAGSSARSTSEASRSPAEIRTKGDNEGSNRTGSTQAMGQATGGSAVSPQDVRLQQQGQPTHAAAAKSGKPAAADGADRQQRIAADLDRARSLDEKDDSTCMGAINDARKTMATD